MMLSRVQKGQGRTWTDRRDWMAVQVSGNQKDSPELGIHKKQTLLKMPGPHFQRCSSHLVDVSLTGRKGQSTRTKKQEGREVGEGSGSQNTAVTRVEHMKLPDMASEHWSIYLVLFAKVLGKALFASPVTSHPLHGKLGEASSYIPSLAASKLLV